ncbi:MAG: ABC transporter ATP-binding protein [Nitrospira sp.]|nr:ABC transporter ATP-binding protein [Nitrospira sp.]MBH0187150.1 ABC transporter ATP-binding protein [Nitrospira sp.]
MVRFEAIRKEFGNFTAVGGLTLDIPQGEIFGLLGPNGAGKTTTIKMACGLVVPTSGRIMVAGVDVQKGPEVAQQHIGYLSDVYALYDDLRVWEYLDYFAHAYRMNQSDIRPRILEVIGAVGLDVKEQEFISGLSRGMRQRLGLARAMLHRPKVLLLDEPASGLDPKARTTLYEILQALRDKGTTIVISSHILSELDGFCTSIGIMEQGKLVKSGSVTAMTDGLESERLIHIRWIDTEHTRVLALLSQLGCGRIVKVTEQEVHVQCPGTDEHISAVLCALIEQGVKIVSFSEHRRTVQDIYMKTSQHGVM